MIHTFKNTHPQITNIAVQLSNLKLALPENHLFSEEIDRITESVKGLHNLWSNRRFTDLNKNWQNAYGEIQNLSSVEDGLDKKKQIEVSATFQDLLRYCEGFDQCLKDKTN